MQVTVPSSSHNARIKSHHMTKRVCCTSFWPSGLSKCSVSIDDAIGITWCWCWCQWHYMTKCNVTSPFDHLDLTDGMAPLMTLLASCDTDTSINGITWPNKICCTLFWSSWPNVYSGAVDKCHWSMWCWSQCQHCQMTDKII